MQLMLYVWFLLCVVYMIWTGCNKKIEFKFKFEFDQKTSELRVIGLLEGN